MRSVSRARRARAGALFIRSSAALLLAACSAAPNTARAGGRNSALGPELSVGIGGGAGEEAESFVGELGLDIPLDEHWTLGPRLSAYSFEADQSGSASFAGNTFEGSQSTNGSGAGFGGEARFYPKRALDGFWIGAGALYFPIAEVESQGTGRHAATGAAVSAELAAEEIDFIGFAGVGWTFRTAGPTSWSAEIDAGSAGGEAFAALLLRVGFGF